MWHSLLLLQLFIYCICYKGSVQLLRSALWLGVIWWTFKAVHSFIFVLSLPTSLYFHFPHLHLHCLSYQNLFLLFSFTDYISLSPLFSAELTSLCRAWTQSLPTQPGITLFHGLISTDANLWLCEDSNSPKWRLHRQTSSVGRQTSQVANGARIRRKSGWWDGSGPHELLCDLHREQTKWESGSTASGLIYRDD